MRWGLVVSIVLLTAAVGWVLFSGHDFLLAVRSVSPSALAVIAAALVVNALAASLRLKVISADVGHRLPLREALAVVSAGSVAGAVFFQIAGQLIARGALMARSGIPFAAVVVITAYERAVPPPCPP